MRGRNRKMLLTIAAGIVLTGCQATSEDFRTRMWESLMSSGMTEQAQGNKHNAKIAFTAALAQLDTNSEKRRRIWTLLQLGAVEVESKDEKAAQKDFLEALQLCKQLKAHAGEGNDMSVQLLESRAALGMGKTLLLADNLPEAGNYFDDAVHLYTAVCPKDNLGLQDTGRILAEALLGKAEVLARQRREHDCALTLRQAIVAANASPAALDLRDAAEEKLLRVAPQTHLPPSVKGPFEGGQ